MGSSHALVVEVYRGVGREMERRFGVMWEGGRPTGGPGVGRTRGRASRLPRLSSDRTLCHSSYTMVEQYRVPDACRYLSTFPTMIYSERLSTRHQSKAAQTCDKYSVESSSIVGSGTAHIFQDHLARTFTDNLTPLQFLYPPLQVRVLSQSISISVGSSRRQCTFPARIRRPQLCLGQVTPLLLEIFEESTVANKITSI